MRRGKTLDLDKVRKKKKSIMESDNRPELNKTSVKVDMLSKLQPDANSFLGNALLSKIQTSVSQ